jgi:exportin-T
VQIFIKLIKDWCAEPYSEEKVPGFQNFVIEAFATNCCLYSVLDKSFNFSDANTVSLRNFNSLFILEFYLSVAVV